MPWLRLLRLLRGGLGFKPLGGAVAGGFSSLSRLVALSPLGVESKAEGEFLNMADGGLACRGVVSRERVWRFGGEGNGLRLLPGVARLISTVWRGGLEFKARSTSRRANLGSRIAAACAASALCLCASAALWSARIEESDAASDRAACSRLGCSPV